MLKRIWSTICRTQPATVRHETAARGPPGVVETLDQRRLAAWNSLNGLAETVWRFVNESDPPQQPEKSTLQAFHLDLVSQQLALLQSIDEISRRDPHDDGRPERVLLADLSGGDLDAV